MALRDKLRGSSPEYLRYRRKANQEWELAGCARNDGDHDAAKRHTEQAREYEALARVYAEGT